VESVKRTRAPTRIDLGGGWTDVPPYAEEQGGYVCNVAIDRYATVTVTPLDQSEAPAEHGFENTADSALVAAVARRAGARGVRIHLHNDFPVGAGLGGSSAASVALLAALERDPVTSGGALAELSRRIETEDLGVAGGRQDHYASVFGGALGLGFSREGVAVERIRFSASAREELESRAMIVYTGESRISGDTIVAVLDAYRARSRGVCDALAAMARLARQMPAALADGDIDTLSALVDEQWHHQRTLHPAIPTPRIDQIIEGAHAAGATGGKALGASGGGCVLILAPRERMDDVRRAVSPLGEPLDFHVDVGGVRACP
jgi:D-glycero-alpha-D-manno-heptose-7-phosphate kinase